MSMILDGSNGVTFNDASLQGAAASPFGLKNRIINGDMVINQRNLGTVTVTASGYNTVDRWQANQTASSKYSVQQSTTAPTGFSNSILCTSLSAYSVSSSDIFFLVQPIEGYNTVDLSWGTANAKTVTLSFWTRSSLTGTFGGALANATQDYCYPFTYTISAANTWEQKTVTITGATAGTWVTTNGVGMQVIFGLGGGSTRSATAGSWTTSAIYTATGATSVVGTNGATFYITGVQLERNTTATPFEWLPYGTELALCQRYYITVGGDSANQGFSTAQAFSTIRFNGVTLSFPVKMRTTPTFSYSSLSHFYIQDNIGGGIIPTAITQGASEGSTMCGSLGGMVSSGLSAGNAALFFAGSTSARLNFSAEL
jgi:hypothetical protein